MSIITYPLNNITYNAEDAETYLCTRTSGVFSAEDCFSATATGSDRTVTISKGLAWIKNDDYRGKSICSTGDTKIDIPLASGSLSRIDRIVLRFDTNYNASIIALKQGTASQSPVAPDVEQTPNLYELGLCEVKVNAGTVFVEQKDITPTLLDERVCGVMSDGVKGIPTQQLFDKFSRDFNEWFENIQAQLSGDVATHLQQQINEINTTLASYETKYISAEQKGTQNGVASLDGSGKVPQEQLPDMDYIPTSQKGNANGVATLGSNGKVTSSELPTGLANGVASLDNTGKLSPSQIPDTLQRAPQYKKIVQDEVDITLEDNTEYYIEFAQKLSITVGKVNCHLILKNTTGNASGGINGGGVSFIASPEEITNYILRNKGIFEMSTYYSQDINTTYIIAHQWEALES